MRLHWMPLALFLSTGSTLVFDYITQDYPQLNVDNIVAIRTGMNELRVKELLGEPLRVSIMTSNVRCRCNPQRICNNVATYTFEYTKKREDYPFPMVWVHFDQQHEVKEVFVKKYVWGNKWPIYRVNRELCDTLDEYFPADERDRVDSLRLFFE